jgi:hypothetical protein
VSDAAQPARRPLRFYGAVSERDPLAWEWVEQQLRDAGTYWIVGRGSGSPPARPVWGIWHEGAVYLSVGSPAVRGAIAGDAHVTVHLDSGTDVVIVEGVASAADMTPGLIGVYGAKYDWEYDAASYGPFTRVPPAVVKAWRTAGPAGRESFQQVGRWEFPGAATH